MPGTQYTYRIRLEGGRAIADAQKFKTALEKELSKIQFRAKLDMSGVQQQLKAGIPGMEGATKTAGDQLSKAMKKTARGFQAEVGRLAPKTFLEPMKQSIAYSVANPSKQAITHLNKLQAAIKKTAEATKRMGVGVDEWASMGKMERFATALQAAQRRWWGVRGMGYQLQSRGRGMFMAGAAGIGGMAVAIKEYLQYAEPMNRAARNLELNAQMTELLSRKLIDLAGTTSYFSPEEQAQQLYLWAAATGEVVDDQEQLNAVLERTNEVQKLALLGNVTQARAVEAVTDIQSQYQLSVEETERIVGTLVKVAAVSKAEIDDLSLAFAYAGARADQANTSFDETAAVFQILSAYGMRGSRAGRGLARLFENLIAPSRAAKEVMDELFEDVFGRTDVMIDAQGRFIGLAEAVRILDEATKDLTESEKASFVAKITTENAARVLIPLLQMQEQARLRNIDAIEAQTNILQGQVGEHEKAFVSMMNDVMGYEVSTKSAIDTLDDYWRQFMESDTGRAQRVRVRWQGALDRIGKAATEVAIGPLEDLSERFAAFVERATSDAENLERIFKLIAGLTIGGAGLMALGKGVTLYADVKAILMARQMMKSADDNLKAALLMVQAARMQLQAAGIQVTGGAAGTGGMLFLPQEIARQGAGGIRDLPAAFAGVLGTKVGLGAVAIGHAAFTAQMVSMRADQATMEGFTEAERAALIYGPGGRRAGENTPFEVRAGEIRVEATGDIASLQAVYQYLVDMGVASDATTRKLEQLNEAIMRARIASGLAYGQAFGEHMAQSAAATEDAAGAAARLGGAMGFVIQEFQRLLSLGLPGFVWSVVDAFSGLGDQMETLFNKFAPVIQGIQDVRHAIPTPAEVGAQAAGTAEAGWGQLVGLVGIVDPRRIRELGDLYEEELTALYMGLIGMSQGYIDLEVAIFNQGWADRIQGFRDYASEMQRLQKQSAEDQARFAKQAQDSFRQMVGQMLQPTAVTAEDMWATDVGIYEDKWDEYARRLRAAALGEEEWKSLIPVDVWGDEQARGQWVQQQLDNFYAGLLPDEVNWGAFVENFKQHLAREMGKEKLIDVAIEELAKEGITATRADVLKVMGLESPLQRMYFGGMTPTEAGTQLQDSIGTALDQVTFDPEQMTPAASFVGTFSGAVGTQLSDVGWTVMLVNAWWADLDDNYTAIEGVGKRVGTYIFNGVQSSLESHSFVQAIVAQVMDELADLLEENFPPGG